MDMLTCSRLKYYHNNLFFKVSRNFIAQTGDPKNDGTGGSSVFGYASSHHNPVWIKLVQVSSTGTTRVQQASVFEDVPKPCKLLYRLGDTPNKCNDIYPAKPAYRGATLSILLPCYVLYSSSSTIVVVQLLTLPKPPPGFLR
jgi:hypothetical protein